MYKLQFQLNYRVWIPVKCNCQRKGHYLMFCSKNEKKTLTSNVVNNVNVFAFKMIEKCVVSYIFVTNMNYEV